MKNILILFLFCMFSFCCSEVALAGGMGQIGIAWDLNKEADVVNQPDAGYNVYYIKTNGNEMKTIDVGNGDYNIDTNPDLEYKYTITGIDEGEEYKIYVTCYDSARNESGPSNSVVSIAKNVVAPSPPKNLRGE